MRGLVHDSNLETAAATTEQRSADVRISEVRRSLCIDVCYEAISKSHFRHEMMWASGFFL